MKWPFSSGTHWSFAKALKGFLGIGGKWPFPEGKLPFLAEVISYKKKVIFAYVHTISHKGREGESKKLTPGLVRGKKSL